MAYPPPTGQPSSQQPLPPSAAPVSKVLLHVRCHKLLDKDITSKSDPMVALYMQQKAGQWSEVGRTENIKNSLDPEFARPFEVDYFFEEVQALKFGVYDLDNKTPSLSDDDFLGQMECSMGQIVSASPFQKPLLYKNGSQAGKGSITVTATEIGAGPKDVLKLHFRGRKLDSKDFMGKSDPFLEFYKVAANGGWQLVHRTEVVKNDLYPSWKMFDVAAQSLCDNNDYNKAVLVKCSDYDSDGSHDLIGEFQTNVNEMMQAVDKEMTWDCINPMKKAKKKSYKDSGKILLVKCQVKKVYSFLDYIFGGCQICFTVGIDFTASNGNPLQETSLHYMNPYHANEYCQAIRAVGAVCQDYDTDKMFPALGFGARIPPAMQVSFEFPLNFNPSNPFCAGVEGILTAYQQCLPQIQLYGPTNVAPIIYHVAKFAAEAQKQTTAHQYFVLLLLTDGVLSDLAQTIESIVYASQLPMSIIIVGVGGADFTDMNRLDGDDGVLRAGNGQPVHRDIVQFVPFRDFKASSPARLASAVLAELPSQVCRYYSARSIVPAPAVLQAGLQQRH